MSTHIAGTCVPIAIQSQAEAGTCDLGRESTDQPQTETVTVEELRTEFAALNAQLETKAATTKQIFDEAFPLLEKMQAVLSQRGDERARAEAGLPTWGFYYEQFRKRCGLPTIRQFQRRLRAKSGKPATPRPKSNPERKPFRTGEAAQDDYNCRLMLNDLVTQIGKMQDSVPAALVKTADEFRKILNTFPAILPQRLQAPVKKPSPSRGQGQSWAEILKRSDENFARIFRGEIPQPKGAVIKLNIKPRSV